MDVLNATDAAGAVPLSRDGDTALVRGLIGMLRDRPGFSTTYVEGEHARYGRSNPADESLGVPGGHPGGALHGAVRIVAAGHHNPLTHADPAAGLAPDFGDVSTWSSRTTTKTTLSWDPASRALGVVSFAEPPGGGAAPVGVDFRYSMPEGPTGRLVRESLPLADQGPEPWTAAHAASSFSIPGKAAGASRLEEPGVPVAAAVVLPEGARAGEGLLRLWVTKGDLASGSGPIGRTVGILSDAVRQPEYDAGFKRTGREVEGGDGVASLRAGFGDGATRSLFLDEGKARAIVASLEGADRFAVHEGFAESAHRHDLRKERDAARRASRASAKDGPAR